MTPVMVLSELRRLEKLFRLQGRVSKKAAKKERDSDCQVTAALYEGNASAMEYCADHLYELLRRIRGTEEKMKRPVRSG